jgi:hypothetical protein
MSSFDFITDEDFRTSLESDFKEMNSCMQAGAYKSAVVIAGSIVEAVLIDYVIAENIIAREDALKLDFGKVLTLCKDKRIISEKSSDLSSVIKGYRNLIHPGRALRLNESVDKDSAEVSRALVNIILAEVEKQKKENYGYTAEQIIAKIKSDSNTPAILSILIKKTNQKELERLMIKCLPDAYLDELRLEDDWNGDLTSFRKPTLVTCFRQSFDNADEKLRKKIANWFAKLIQEESETIISSYGIAFLRASDMKYMDPEDAEIVKQHIFGQMKNSLNNTIIELLPGIGPFLNTSDIGSFIDPFVRSVSIEDEENEWDILVINFLIQESIYDQFDPKVKKLLMDRLLTWEKNFTRRKQGSKAVKVKNLWNAIDIPF